MTRTSKFIKDFSRDFNMPILLVSQQTVFHLAFKTFIDTDLFSWNVIAECVPGGTSTASLWLSIVAGYMVGTPSSSQVHGRRDSTIRRWCREALLEYNGQDSISGIGITDFPMNRVLHFKAQQ